MPKFDLNLAFFEYLWIFYHANKKDIRKSYKFVTKRFLDFNNPKIGDAFLRVPQFEALEMYIFLKEYLNNERVYRIFEDWHTKAPKFKNRTDAGLQGEQLDAFGNIASKSYEQVFKQMKAFGQIYPNYIYALSMGTGKTILMATCIFYEFILAGKYPEDKRYCHNALVFAPDKTVLQSLNEIQTFPKELVVPPQYLNWLNAYLNFHFLDDTGATLNAMDHSRYNIVISNTQKIILKQRSKNKSAQEQLLNVKISSYKAVGIHKKVEDLHGFNVIENESDLTANQRFWKLITLSQLGIYVDEAHHAFGTKLANDMGIKTTQTSLRLTINEIAHNIEAAGSQVVGCYNYTGTPYIGKHVLPEVVYSYGLQKSINNNYLKKVALHEFENPKSEEFLKIVISNFWSKFGENRREGMLPKLAIFSPTIEDLSQNLKPVVEEVLAGLGVSTDKILVNVGDPKHTSNDEIREFNNLDKSKSNKQFILLVNKGREGWNCRSLFGVALHRKPKSKIFVLQATMRCLRAIGDVQETGQVYLSEENKIILENELNENYRMTSEEFTNSGSKKLPFKIKVIPPKVTISIKRVKKLFEKRELTPDKPILLDFDKFDTERYQIIHKEYDSLKAKNIVKKEDVSWIRDQRKFSKISLVGEIARYLNRSPLGIDKLIDNTVEGVEEILNRVNEFNELLYDWIIPKLFTELFKIVEFENIEDDEVNLVKWAEDEEFTFHAEPHLVMSMDEWTASVTDKQSFHISPYCFDSIPEKKLFTDLLGEEKVKAIYFTGMLTQGQSEFNIQYIDPETHSIRSYYPDFLVQQTDDSWVIIEVKGDNKIEDPVVLAKSAAASIIAAKSKMRYEIIKGSDVNAGRASTLLS
jgi:type III restriction enzyme